MPFRFLVDENVKDGIVTGLLQRSPELEIICVRDKGLAAATDDEILTWAAEHDCVIVSHDVSTMTADAYARVRRGDKMSGLMIVPQNLGIGMVIDELLFIAECSMPGEWEGKVQFIPL